MNGLNQIIELYERILATHGELTVWFVTEVGDGKVDDFRQLVEIRIDHDDREICYLCRPSDDTKPIVGGCSLSEVVRVMKVYPKTCEAYEHVETRSIRRVIDGETFSRADFPIARLQVDAGRLYCLTKPLS